MPETSYSAKNARARFKALPRCRKRIEFPLRRETGRARLRCGPIAIVLPLRIRQEGRLGLSPWEIWQWQETRDRHEALAIRGMERYRGPAVGRADGEPHAVLQNPRRPEDTARQERPDSWRRSRIMTHGIPAQNPPVRHALSSPRPYVARFPLEVVGGRQLRKDGVDARNVRQPAKTASAKAIPSDFRERSGSPPECLLHEFSTPFLPTGSQVPQTRLVRRHASSRIRQDGNGDRDR